MDDTEFAALYRASARRLVGLTYTVCGDLGEAQDCVQEAFVRAWVRRRRLDTAGHPEAWLRVTALRLAVSGWRRSRARDRAHTRIGPSPMPPEPDGVRLDVVTAMAALPPTVRIVLALHYVCDLPVRDIATQLDMPDNTVKSHLVRGRAALRTALSSYANDVGHRDG